MSVKRITPEETKQLLDSDPEFIYLDVRTVQEFDSGHVPGAKNIPFIEPAMGRMHLNPQFVEMVEGNFGKDAKLIVGCQIGGRSVKAAEMLLSAGFTSVLEMRGGFSGESDASGHLVFPGWAPRGLPVSFESSPDDRYENLSKAGAR